MSAKQGISDKLQGSVATYLTCGEIFNNQIKKGISPWVKKIKSVNIWQSYKQLSMPGQQTKKRRKCMRQSALRHYNHKHYTDVTVLLKLLLLYDQLWAASLIGRNTVTWCSMELRSTQFTRGPCCNIRISWNANFYFSLEIYFYVS